jgi:Uma2 family endonuclease
MAITPGTVPAPPTDLPETDEQPLESPWHRACMNLLIESVEMRFAGRKDFYTGGNMFVYFSARQVRNRDYSGPDFFFVHGPGVDHDRPRLYWAVWDEDGRYPNVIIELSSPTTAEEDHTTRKVLYERTFRTAEYYIYDPTTQVLEGWRLVKRRYRPIKPNRQGRLWCEELGLWVGTWRGTFQGHEDLWLRYYDPDGAVVTLPGEREWQGVSSDRRRAEAAEAEAARLRQELEALRRSAPPSP